jgi:hypothetical protein
MGTEIFAATANKAIESPDNTIERVRDLFIYLHTPVLLTRVIIMRVFIVCVLLTRLFIVCVFVMLLKARDNSFIDQIAPFLCLLACLLTCLLASLRLCLAGWQTDYTPAANLPLIYSLLKLYA